MNILSKFKKGVASFLLLAMSLVIMPAFTFAGVEDFTDAAEIPSWADEAIQELMAQGVVQGNGDGSFAPARQLNRAEVAKIIVLATGLEMDTSGGEVFPDVTQSDWFFDYVMTMYNYGMINGYPDGYFRPGVGINRAEIAKMVVEGFELDIDTTGGEHFSDVTEDDWFYGYVETVFNNGLMRGYASGEFDPNGAVTRAETVKVVYDAQLVVAGPVGPAEGTLEVVLSGDTPRGTNIPYNATSVPFLTVELTASDDSDVEVSALTFTRLGLGDNDDFDNVWLEVDGFKVGNEKSVSNNDTAELRFNPPIVVPAGQTLVADMVASLKGNTNTVGQNSRFAMVSGVDVVSTAANVVGDFPIEGEEMEIANYQVSQLEFSSLGSDTNVDVGDSFIEIGKFRMLNKTTTNKDVELRAITFKNDGTAQLADVLENVALYVSGEQVSAETIIDGDYITFRLDNGVTGGYVIEDGDSRIFSLRADIVSAEDGDVINFKVDNFEDIVGVEIGTAFGVKAVSGDTNGTTLSTTTTSTDTSITCGNTANAEDNCARLKAYAIDTGDINVSRDPASLGNQEYAPGSNDVVFLTARIVVDQPVIVDGVNLKVLSGTEVFDTVGGTALTGTAAVTAFDNQFDNFRLFLNDSLIDTENNLGTSLTELVGAGFDFNTTFEIAGTSVLKLVGNVKDEAITGSKVKIGLDANDFTSPEYISTGDQVTSDTLLGSAEASFVTVQQSSLTITRTDGFTSETVVAGVNDATFLKFVLDNNDSGDINVTSVTVKATGTGNGATFSNYNAAVFVEGTQQASAKNLSSAGEATFNDLSVNIATAAQKEFTLVVDTIEASAAGNPGSTTVVDLSGSTTTAAAAGSVFNGIGATYSVGTSMVEVAGDQTALFPAGAELRIYEDPDAIVDGNITSYDGDEVNSNTATVTSFSFAGGNTQIYFTPALTTQVDEAANNVGVARVQTNYTNLASPGETGIVIQVASTTDITVGDIVNLNGSLNNDFTVTAVDTGASTLTLTAPAVYVTEVDFVAATDYTITAGITVIEDAASGSTVTFTVTAVDADNVENGQNIEVLNGGTALSAANPLTGTQFAIVESGVLQVELGTVISEDILIANSSANDVVNVQFKSFYDAVEVRDIFIANDSANDGVLTANMSAAEQEIGDRADFKLYDEAGNFISDKQMIGGRLHFELSNADRIMVPKDEEVFVTVKADIRDLNRANQTGKQMVLELDNTNGDGVVAATDTGIEAVTAATGSDLSNTSINGTFTGRNMVVYRSEMSVSHASFQPAITGPSLATQEFYRFTVTADSAYSVDLNRLTFQVDLDGMVFTTTTPTVEVFKVNETTNNLETTTVVATAAFFDTDTGTFARNTGDLPPEVTDTTGIVEVVFNTDQGLSAGESRTYGIRMNQTADSAAAQDDDDSFSVTILQDSAYPTTDGITTAADIGDGADDSAAAAFRTDDTFIVWSDESAVSHTTATSDWTNGYLLDVDTTPYVNAD